MKRFIFEFTDFQLYLFYIGLYQLDIKLLRTNLIALFMVDEARRVITEVVLPLIMQNKEIIVEKGLERTKSLIKKSGVSDQKEHGGAEHTSDIEQTIIEEESLKQYTTTSNIA